MINTTFENFIKLKSTALLSVTCDACGKEYYKTKKQLHGNDRSVYDGTNFNTHKNSCSKICQNKLQIKPEPKTITLKCLCGNIFETNSYRPSRFCSRKCANSNRIKTDATKTKIRESIKKYYTLHPNPDKITYCNWCKSEMMNTKRKTCSNECLHNICQESGVVGGRKSATKMSKRSKSEIKLFNLIKSEYDCIANQPIFNGWDADIIIPNLKLAILWNGIWHYSKVKEKHSLEQVQNRDWIKLNEIMKCGYAFIIVKDYKNKMTPQKAFALIKECIYFNNTNLSLV